MAELEVIYDPAKELAAIINVDDRIGWGPAMIGPNAGMILQAFIDTAPFDLSTLAGYDAKRAFDSFLERTGMAATEPPAQTDPVATQPIGDTSMDTTDQLAQAEASNASDVPAPAPADTDQPAPTNPTPQVIECPNCNGTGSVKLGDDETLSTCGMCNGTRQVTIGAVT